MDAPASYIFNPFSKRCYPTRKRIRKLGRSGLPHLARPWEALFRAARAGYPDGNPAQPAHPGNRGDAVSRTSLLLIFVLAVRSAADEPPKPPLIVKPDAFPTLVNPKCSHCRDEAKRRAGELRDDDRVLCWTRGYSDGGAIPFRFFLNSYRVISDSYGVFVYDPDAGFARGYLPSYHFRF